MKKMKNQFHLSKKLLLGGVLALAMSTAYADPACDAEIVTLQAEIDAPTTVVSAADLEQAQQMLNVLNEDCNGGSTLDGVATLADDIRSLLGIGEA